VGGSGGQRCHKETGSVLPSSENIGNAQRHEGGVVAVASNAARVCGRTRLSVVNNGTSMPVMELKGEYAN